MGKMPMILHRRFLDAYIAEAAQGFRGLVWRGGVGGVCVGEWKSIPGRRNSTEKKQRLEFTFTKGTLSVARVEKLRWEKIQT